MSPKTYWRLTYQTPATEGRDEKTYQQPGDHLFIAEISGRRQVYVRLGDGNPFLPLVAGRTYKREFDRITFRVDETVPVPAGLGVTRVICFASWGPLVEESARMQGLNGGFLTGSGLASAVPASLFAGAGSGTAIPTPGKLGGVLFLDNTDLTNTLFVRYGNPAIVGAVVAAQWYAIPAGGSRVFGLSGLIHTSAETVLVGTTGGTASFSFLVSPGAYDLSDTAQAVGVSIP